VASKSTTLTEVSFHPGNGNEVYPMYGIECAQDQKISAFPATIATVEIELRSFVAS
jgi:hypothetical protein